MATTYQGGDKVAIVTFRSAIEDYQRCPRKRFLKYHYDGTGIVPERTPQALETGIIVHEALAQLLRGKEPKIRQVEDPEQWALARALVWLAKERVIPGLLEQYEVLDVEREESMQLTDLFPMEMDEEYIVLLGRADAILRDKSDGSIVILNFKTTSQDPRGDSRKESSMFYHGLQTAIEAMIVNDRLRRVKEALSFAAATLEEGMGYPGVDKVVAYLKKLVNNGSFRVAATKIVFLIKGQKRKDKDGNTYVANALIRGYRRGNERSPFYRAGWTPFKAWEDPGLDEWLKTLPNDVLDQYVFIPHDCYRTEDEQSLIQEIAAQELEIIEKLKQGKQAFPMYRHSCDYPTACEYQPICWGPADLNPFEVGFVPRRSHHPMEEELRNATD
jgi:hypothetical protein